MSSPYKKRAYHDLQLPDGTIVKGPVSITLDVDDKLVSWHHLSAEEPFTEWIGGLYIAGK